MLLIRLLGKQIGFALPQNHATMDLILKEMKKLLDEGADLYPLIFDGNGSLQERRNLEEKMVEIMGDMTDRSHRGKRLDIPQAFDLLVIAPCPGNMLKKILNASEDPDIQVKTLIHMQTGRPIVLALVANGSSGDLVRHIEQLLNLKSSYLIPVGPLPHLRQQFIITRMDLIKETVVDTFMHGQVRPIIFEHHWLPS